MYDSLAYRHRRSTMICRFQSWSPQRFRSSTEMRYGLFFFFLVSFILIRFIRRTSVRYVWMLFRYTKKRLTVADEKKTKQTKKQLLSEVRVRRCKSFIFEKQYSVTRLVKN